MVPAAAISAPIPAGVAVISWYAFLNADFTSTTGNGDRRTFLRLFSVFATLVVVIPWEDCPE